MKIQTVVALIFLVFGSPSWAKESFEKKPRMENWINEYNKNRTSKTSYLKWLSQYESQENIEFLKKHFIKYPNLELRKLEVVDGDLTYRGKKTYIRINISDLKNNKVNIYGKEKIIPVYKPFSSILQVERSNRAAQLIYDLLIPSALAEDITWNDNLDTLTSLRLWIGTTFSHTVYSNGKHSTYCRSEKYDAITNWFKSDENTSETDPEEACYQLLIHMGKVSIHYNKAMEEYPANLKTSNNFDKASQNGGATAGLATASSLAGQSVDVPGCILKNIVTWKRSFCRQMRQGKYKNCKITASNPRTLFNCSETFESRKLPEKIGIGISYQESGFNKNGSPSNSGSK